MEWQEGKGSNSMIESLEIVSQNVKIEKQGSTEIKKRKKYKMEGELMMFKNRLIIILESPQKNKMRK